MINRELLKSLKEQFVQYTNQFTSKDIFVQQHFKVKQLHTFKVCENIVELGKKTGLNEEDLLIAEISALFHDIGRFQQYQDYMTFSDFESSVNHSEIGIKVINSEGFFKDLLPETRNLIFNIILNHNIAELQFNTDERLSILSKLLRDADKIDIFRVVMEYDKQEKELKVEEENSYFIPDEILFSFTKRKIVDIKSAQSKFDYFLLRISWIFDINFPQTFHLLDQKGYIKYMLERIPKSYRLINIQNIVREYMVEKIFSYA